MAAGFVPNYKFRYNTIGDKIPSKRLFMWIFLIFGQQVKPLNLTSRDKISKHKTTDMNVYKILCIHRSMGTEKAGQQWLFLIQIFFEGLQDSDAVV